MTQDEIIRMAREAGFEVVDGQLRLYFDGSKALLKPNYMGTIVDGLKEFATIVAAHVREKLAEQEPVAEVIVRPLRGDQSQPTTDIKWLQKPTTGKLYAAPARTKDLTDDEIHDVFKSLGFSLADPRTEDFSVARAVIAAYKEKNK